MCACASSAWRSSPGTRPGAWTRERRVRTADGRGPDPQRSRARPGSSRRLPPGSFAIHARNEEVLTPTAAAAIRFRGGACHPASSRSLKPASPPGRQTPGRRRRNRTVRARRPCPRRTERTMPSAFRRPCGFQPQPAPWPVHPPGRRAEQLKPMPGWGTHSLAARPGRLAGSLSIVRRAGIEPARLPALVPGTSVSA